jgi:hypothetical protein
MKSGPARRFFRGLVLLGSAALVLPLPGSAQAAAPVVTVGPAGTKIKVTQSTLSEAIDALSRAAGFKVTYDGPRPNVMIYNAEIDTPTVAGTLFRLIDGQNLNYAVMFDKTGRKVTSLMVMGVPPKAGGGANTPVGAARPQAFSPPRTTRTDAPAAEDDPAAPAEPEPEPTPSPTPRENAAPPRPGPLPPSPFAPRPPFGSPFGPRPTPSPTPST